MPTLLGQLGHSQLGIGPGIKPHARTEDGRILHISEHDNCAWRTGELVLALRLAAALFLLLLLRLFTAAQRRRFS